MNTILVTFQLLIALGLLNVWLIRSRKPTEYRGGDSKNIVEEFASYGLPLWMCYSVGFLKIGAAVALLLGFFEPTLVLPAAALITGLMIAAVALHAKVGDPIKKSVPAALMLLMSASLSASHFL